MTRFPLGKRLNFLASSSVKGYLIPSERSFRTFTISNTARASTRLAHHCRYQRHIGRRQDPHRRIGDNTRSHPHYVSLGAPWRPGFCPTVRFLAGRARRHYLVRARKPLVRKTRKAAHCPAQSGRPGPFSGGATGRNGPLECSGFRQGISGSRNPHSSRQTAY
jgi:hypothetical protein